MERHGAEFKGQAYDDERQAKNEDDVVALILLDEHRDSGQIKATCYTIDHRHTIEEHA